LVWSPPEVRIVTQSYDARDEQADQENGGGQTSSYDATIVASTDPLSAGQSTYRRRRNAFA
jgi:hypothetical protein